MENTKRDLELGKSIRFVLAVVAVMLAVFCMPIGGRKINAADNLKVTVGGDGNISGTLGSPIQEQTITLTVENGKFDTVQFYVGRDISDFFDYNTYYGNASILSVNRGSWFGIDYIKPIGLKVVVTETSEEKITCKVKGTPISPSTNEIKVYFLPSMFIEGTANYFATSSSSLNWDVKPNGTVNVYSISMSELSADALTGVAGETEFNVDFTISVTNGMFVTGIPKDTDVTDWFSFYRDGYSGKIAQLPVGLKVKTTSEVKVGDTSCSLKLYGKSTYKSTNMFKAYISSQYVAGFCSKTDKYYSGNSNSNNDQLGITTNDYSFDISGDENEVPYIVPYSGDITVFSGKGYSKYDLPFYFVLYNGKLNVNSSGIYDVSSESNLYQYSNTDGVFDTSAPGFMYSAGKTSKISAYENKIRTYGSVNYIYLVGQFDYLGTYDTSFFVPLSWLEGNENEVGYTKVVKNGHINVVKPIGLEIEDTDITAKIGSEFEGYITVRPSYKAYLKKFKKDLTVDTLEYKVSEKIKGLGLDLTPILVNEDFVIFKISGTLTGKPGAFSLNDCVSLGWNNYARSSYTFYEEVWSTFGDTELNPNPDAVLNIIGKEGDISAKKYELEKEDGDAPDIWVNGKDDKKLKSYAKTFTLDGKLLVSSIPSGCKAIVSVTDTKVDSHEDAFSNGKGQKSSVAKASYKQGKVVVTAGKTEGTARVWLAAYDSKKKLYKACGYFDIVVGTAPKKIILTSNPSDDPEATKAVTVVKSDKEDCYQTLYAYASGSELSKYSTFIWTKSKDNNLLELVPSDDTHCCVIKVKSAPTGGKAVKASVEAVCVESGKKFKCTVLIENPVREIKGLSKEIKIESAKESAKTKEFKISLVGSDSKQPITDKVKVLVTSNIKEHEGWTSVEGSNKIKLSEPSKNIKASYKDGTLTIKVSKGTEDGTQAKLIFVYTGAGKDSGGMDESYIVTVG